MRKFSNQKTVEVISAIVEPDSSGISIRVKNEKNELEGFFVPKDAWGKIPKNSSAERELGVIANLFNGLRLNENQEWVPVENFKYKKITIETN